MLVSPHDIIALAALGSGGQILSGDLRLRQVWIPAGKRERGQNRRRREDAANDGDEVFTACGASPDTINTKRSGVYEGIPYEHNTSVKRPRNGFARALVYMRALLSLTVRLARLGPARRETLIYLYVGDGPMNFYVRSLRRLLGLPSCRGSASGSWAIRPVPHLTSGFTKTDFRACDRRTGYLQGD